MASRADIRSMRGALAHSKRPLATSTWGAAESVDTEPFILILGLARGCPDQVPCQLARIAKPPVADTTDHDPRLHRGASMLFPAALPLSRRTLTATVYGTDDTRSSWT